MAKLNFETIQEAITKYEGIIPTRNKNDMKKLFDSLNMSLIEVSYWQQRKNLAMMSNIIDKESAMFIYRALNEWLMEKPMTIRALAKRIVLTQVFERIRRERV